MIIHRFLTATPQRCLAGQVHGQPPCLPDLHWDHDRLEHTSPPSKTWRSSVASVPGKPSPKHIFAHCAHEPDVAACSPGFSRGDCHPQKLFRCQQTLPPKGGTTCREVHEETLRKKFRALLNCWAGWAICSLSLGDAAANVSSTKLGMQTPPSRYANHKTTCPFRSESAGNARSDLRGVKRGPDQHLRHFDE